MTDGYLSKDRKHLARNQRERRARMVRIDYMPDREALAILQARRARERPNSVGGTNSAVLDAILKEWASLTGLNNQYLERPMTSAASPEFSYRSAHARMTSEPLPDWLLRSMARAENRNKQGARAPCGAKRHRDGQPCKALSEPGKRRCRFHGGRSTGPRTPQGKLRALANLRKGPHVPSDLGQS